MSDRAVPRLQGTGSKPHGHREGLRGVVAAAGLLAMLVVACGGSSATSTSVPSTDMTAGPPSIVAPSATSPVGPSTSPGSASPTAATTPTPATPLPSGSSAPSAGEWPSIGHIYEIVFENHAFKDVIGNSDAPYLNELAGRYGLATSYLAITHPSEPNYLALWSGSTQGVTDDDVHDFKTGSTLADQIEQAGRAWHVAAENVPPDCFTGATAKGGADGTGKYVRKHEPAINWTSVSGDARRCANIVDLTHFDPGQGDFWLIVPNMCHDMHDCSLTVGDAWLKSFLPTILSSAAYQADGLVLITFDEGVGDPRGGRVATLVISPAGRMGFTSATPHDHYSMLRTIETLWGMPCLANSCTANTLREFFP